GQEVRRCLREGGRVGAQEPGRIAHAPGRLHRDRRGIGQGGAAVGLHALQRVHAERRRLLPEVLRRLHRSQDLQQEAGREVAAVHRLSPRGRSEEASMSKVLKLDRRWLPLLGPLLLFALWQLLISAQFVKPVLLPPPGATLAHMASAFASGAICGALWATIFRTLCSFGIATVIGVPLGVMLGSSEAAYRSVEFLIDFFRSTPSSALIPLFLLIFGITDINKIAIASFGAMLIVLFNSAYGVMHAKKTRVMAALIMGVSKWHVFKDVMLMESLAQTFVGLRSAVSMALVIVIVAEMFIGSENGLGHRIIDAQQVFNVKEMYCSILVTGALGYLLN